MTALVTPRLLRREAAHATGIGGMLALAATLAERNPDTEAIGDIDRAAHTAEDWAHGLLARLGEPDDSRPPSARERGEISDPRLVLRGQMLENKRRRMPGQP